MPIYKLTTVGAYNYRVEKALRAAGARRGPDGDFYVEAEKPPKVWGCRARRVQPKQPEIIRTEQDWDRWLGRTFGIK